MKKIYLFIILVSTLFNLRLSAQCTIELSSAASTNNQTVCLNTAIINITYTTTGATGATFSGLPAGVNGFWVADTITIIGAPSESGTFNYTVSLTGGCGTLARTGTITVKPINTITLTALPGTIAQTVCINSPITKITYATTEATDATVTGLPSGVTYKWANDTVTINGSPAASSGTFTYIVSLSSGCGIVSTTGTITVTPVNTISLTSAPGTIAQAVCSGSPIINITYATTGASGVTFDSLPAGVTGIWANNVVTISGTPTQTGSFIYTVNLTGGCGTVQVSGNIISTIAKTFALFSPPTTTDQTVCINTAIAPIIYVTTGATGANVDGLPAGVNSRWVNDTVIITGTPVNSPGIFNYTVNLTGGCGIATASGSIIVKSSNTITLTSLPGTTAQRVCINSAIDKITYTTTGAEGATVTGLPTGVTGTWANNVLTINGSPAESGSFTYKVNLTGGCGIVKDSGTITVASGKTISLTSPDSTTMQTVCINTAIVPVTYATSGATGATFSGLPAGVIGFWVADTITIIGTPTAPGTFTYTVNLTGGCGTVTTTGTITVKPANTVALTSLAGSDAQTVCVNTAITAITYATSGATGATVTGLPSGVTYKWANDIVTINGSPAASSGTFTYAVTLTGGCATVTTTGTITVTPINTISLTSAPATIAQAVCSGESITNIRYATTGASGATFTGLPAGVTGIWANNVVTISGTPTQTGSFTYTVNLTGGCGIATTGSLTVTTDKTINLTSLVSTIAQTICISSPIVNITYTTSGGSGANVTGLPAGVSSSWVDNIVTITGTPVESGTFTYTVSLTGGCGTLTRTGTITVTSANTITRTSLSGTIAQTVCINSAITNITYVTTGANGANVSGLPSGVTYKWANDTVTINGSPAASSGTFTYTVTSTGGCGIVTATGKITVTPVNTISLTSAPGTIAQTICIDSSIKNITYATTGASGASVTGLPPGLIGSWANNVVTISGSTTQSGSFNYKVTLTDGCGIVRDSGIITVTIRKTIRLTSAPETTAQPVCINTAITPITYATTGATGANVTGLPAGVSSSWVNDIITITGTPVTASTSPFSYTVTLTGGCGDPSLGGTITVNPNNTVALSSAMGTDAQTVCINSAITQIFYITTGASEATITGLPPGVSGSRANNVVTINGTPVTSGTFTYTVTLTGGCGIVTTTGTIFVNQTPVAIATPIAQTICSGNNITSIVMSASPSGTVYNWLRDNTVAATGIGATGAGSSINGSLTNTTNAPVTVSFTITPSYTNNGITCTGDTIMVKVVVNPTPVASATPVSQKVCSGKPIVDINLSSNVTTGTMVYNWTRDNTAFVTGIPDSGTGDITGTLTNLTNDTLTVSFTITPSYTNNGRTCGGDSIRATVLVNPIPAINNRVHDTSFCNKESVASGFRFSSLTRDSSFTWKCNPSIGFGTEGAQFISSFIATNTTTVPDTATVRVSIKAYGCSGRDTTFSIVVNPSAISPALKWLDLNNGTLCKGSRNINFYVNAPDTATSYLWSADSPGIIIKDTNSASTVVSFNDAGTYMIKVLATNQNGGCSESVSKTVNVIASGGIEEQKIILKQPGNILIYPNNSMDAVKGYQWGYDSVMTPVPPDKYSFGQPTAIGGQVYQFFIPDSAKFFVNSTLNTTKYNYWVLLQKDGCYTKVYYNGPYAGRPIAVPPPGDNSVLVKVFPNPNNGVCNIQVKGNIYGNMEAKIFNSTGQLVYTKQFAKTTAEIFERLDKNNLPSGLYYLLLSSSDLKKVTTRFIIQH